MIGRERGVFLNLNAIWILGSDPITTVYDTTHWKQIVNIYEKIKSFEMMEIELELTSNSKDVTEILEKVSQLVKRSQELGFEMKELEIESEYDNKEKGGTKVA